MEEHLQKRFLLEDKDSPKDENALLEDFLKIYGDVPGAQSPQQNVGGYNAVQPTPEFCIKTKTPHGDKVFLNICTGDHIPTPKDISDSELVELLDSEDPSKFRIPMSLGEPHAEVDKSGSGCTAYDIVISNSFCDKIKTKELFMGFFMSIVMEGLDQKYNLTLSREWIKLRNKKCMGTILPQHIRREAKPWIMEMDQSPATPSPPNKPKKPIIREVHDSKQFAKAPEPKFRIIQDPTEGYPDFLVAEIELPKIKSANAVMLDIGEDRILLETRSGVYGLDIYLPYNLIQKECGAQFNKGTKMLTITMPVQPQLAGS